MQIFKNEYIYVEVETSEIPWLKIFTCKPYKELSECDDKTRVALLESMLLIETQMIKYYNPKKINIAMFGNYLPRIHCHVMARFEGDSFFPEPMWGQKQRDAKLDLPSFEKFLRIIEKELQER